MVAGICKFRSRISRISNISAPILCERPVHWRHGQWPNYTRWEPIGTHGGNRSGHTLGTDQDTRSEPRRAPELVKRAPELVKRAEELVKRAQELVKRAQEP